MNTDLVCYLSVAYPNTHLVKNKINRPTYPLSKIKKVTFGTTTISSLKTKLESLRMQLLVLAFDFDPETGPGSESGSESEWSPGQAAGPG